jgi:predicted metal-dependent phosphoesterase TrpH
VAQPEASRWKIELIKGIELTCSQDNREIHILGYFIRDDDQALDHALKSLRTGRALRMEVMSERLRTLGFSVDLNALRNVFPHSNLGRRHLADYLVRTHQVINMREVFSRFLADGRPACVDKPRLQSEDAIKLIRGAGGVAALAHPPHDLPRSSLQSLVEEGLQAIEVDGPGFSRSKSQRIGDWANRLGLIRVAGSDFHAADRPGRWVGAITTAQEELERLRKASRCDATNKSASNKLGYG